MTLAQHSMHHTYYIRTYFTNKLPGTNLILRPRVQQIMYVCTYVPYSSKFSRSINFVIFVRCKLIMKILSTKIFSSMGVSIGAAMNHENYCP